MLKLYNTSSHAIEEFKSINPGKVGMYSCGPTVYDFQQIGNMRRYVGDDILVRVLKVNGYDVNQVMNITDVGHLTSDADTGEDKMEKGAKKLGLSVWDIAKKFEQQFFNSCNALNIQRPNVVMKATDNIKEQIELIKKLEEQGFTYKTTDGVYFDTSKFSDYFKLSRQKLEELKGGVRVELGEKKNIIDFALWKFSRPASVQGFVEARQMEWESPWGTGFPGWHIECSAMSMKALGETFDIHTGGIDHVNIHHSNEIAQSEAATGKKFVNYWVHHAFLQVEGQKMSKSLNNFYTVQDVIDKGYDPLALRYLYLQTHYRQEMNFTWEALEAAQTALNKLRNGFSSLENLTLENSEFRTKFMDAINDDLNMPKALATVWGSLNSNLISKEDLLWSDQVLGLSLDKQKEIPIVIQEMLAEREKLRKEKKYEESDEIRKKVVGMGYKVEDKN
jgi:cysteinyl-tRNA synthetase